MPPEYTPSSNTRIKRTPELVAMVADLVGSGTPIKHAAEACGIDRDTIYSWMNSDPAFTAEIKNRRASAVHERVERIREAGKKGKWTADAWYLERQHPEEFGIRTERRDINITVEIRDCTRDEPVQVECSDVKMIEG